MALTNFPYGASSYGIPVMGGMPPFTGRRFFVAPSGWNLSSLGIGPASDGNAGDDPQKPMATIAAAFARCTAGNNDVVVLLGDGTNVHTLTAAITWNKAATHLVGLAPDSLGSWPVQIATQASATAFNALNVTASGCYFGNFQLLQLFTTDSATGIALQDSGASNVYNNVRIIGIAGAAALAGAGARCAKLTGTGTTFWNCHFGSAAYVRSAANATLELASPSDNISFYHCEFEMKTSNAASLFLITAAAGSVVNSATFDNCLFENTIPGSTALTVAYSATAALTGGKVIIKDSMLVGGTKWGDVNGLASTQIFAGTSTALTAGLALAPA